MVFLGGTYSVNYINRSQTIAKLADKKVGLRQQ